MHMSRLLFLSLLLITYCHEIQAAHIIGGVITYDCTAAEQYTITMKVYRDCNGGGARFDSNGAGSIPGTVTVYRGRDVFIREITLGTPQVTSIQPNENACLIVPPNICVEEGVYTFNLNLPLSTEEYTIVYQRCCRNGSISNIVMPGSVGATFFVQISPEAQAVCNDSPVFDNFPPIVICNNEDLVFDHSASDETPGVQLVYSLCAPFIGGGLRGLNNDDAAAAALPDGIAPNPDLPPPYNEVTFVLPFYSFDRPLGGNPVLTIDPNTGIMRGTPNTTGQFVVGVCVQEYHNGILVSEVRRDFQFNVANCERLVFADLQADRVLNDGTFVLNSCGDRTVELINESTNINFIDEYAWLINIPGTPLTFDTRDVVVTFPDTGVFSATMIVNPNSIVDGCRDTAYLQIGVFGAIDADFEFDYDTCVAGPVEFTNLSSTENDRIVSYFWDFDDGDTSSVIDPIKRYQIPGVFDVTLSIEDNRGCRTQATKPLPYFPVPALVIAEPDRFVACNPGLIRFDNLSEPINEDYTIIWDFGDGETGEGLSIDHVYENPGTYSVDIEIISPLGCKNEAMFRNWILIKESPEASFIYTPEELNDLQREVFFSNQSQNADGYQWTFGDGGVAFIESPVHEFADTGVYEVVLIAVASNGCTDTAVAIIDVAPLNTYFLPNAFSPNDDAVNDEFTGKGLLKGIRQFNMSIWNRWGEKVYESDDPREAWNGQLNNNGLPAPKGVYHCLVTYQGARGAMKEVQTSVTLIR